MLKARSVSAKLLFGPKPNGSQLSKENASKSTSGEKCKINHLCHGDSLHAEIDGGDEPRRQTQTPSLHHTEEMLKHILKEVCFTTGVRHNQTRVCQGPGT